MSVNPGKIYVGNLSWGTTDDNLRDAFQQYGVVTDCIVMRDRESGKSRGFGFVTYGSEKEAESAITNMNNQPLDGRQIKVNFANARNSTTTPTYHSYGSYAGGFNSGGAYGTGGGYAGGGYPGGAGYGSGGGYVGSGGPYQGGAFGAPGGYGGGGYGGGYPQGGQGTGFSGGYQQLQPPSNYGGGGAY